MCVNVRKISLPIESDSDEGCFIGTSSMTPRSVLAKSWRRGASDVVTVAPPVERDLVKAFLFLFIGKGDVLLCLENVCPNADYW